MENSFTNSFPLSKQIAAGKSISKPQQQAPVAEQAVPEAKVAVAPAAAESVEHTPSRTSETAKSTKSKTKTAKKPEIVCAIADYKPTSKEQLELKKGQMIQVLKKLDSGWSLGEIQIKGKKKQTGYFPTSYVKSMGKGSGGGGAGGDDSGSQAPPKSPQIVKEEKAERVITLYPYEASQDDELSFQANEVIKILSKEDQTWFKGESETTGKVIDFGFFSPYKISITNLRLSSSRSACFLQTTVNHTDAVSFLFDSFF